MEKQKIKSPTQRIADCLESIVNNGIVVHIHDDSKKSEHIEKKPITALSKIEELELSVRSYNCLSHANLLTVDDVYNAYFNGMLINVRNLGRRGYEEVRAKLVSIGMITE